MDEKSSCRATASDSRSKVLMATTSVPGTDQTGGVNSFRYARTGIPWDAVSTGGTAVGSACTAEAKPPLFYGTLIWAAGGAPRRLPCAGHDLVGVHSVRTRADRLLSRVAAALPDGPVVVFSHGHFSRVLAARWIGLDVTAGRNFLLGTAIHNYGSMGIPVATTALAFLLGLLVIPFAVETKNMRLPD